jgi:hypothetical protein
MKDKEFQEFITAHLVNHSPSPPSGSLPEETRNTGAVVQEGVVENDTDMERTQDEGISHLNVANTDSLPPKKVI